MRYIVVEWAWTTTKAILYSVELHWMDHPVQSVDWNVEYVIWMIYTHVHFNVFVFSLSFILWEIVGSDVSLQNRMRLIIQMHSKFGCFFVQCLLTDTFFSCHWKLGEMSSLSVVLVSWIFKTEVDKKATRSVIILISTTNEWKLNALIWKFRDAICALYWE